MKTWRESKCGSAGMMTHHGRSVIARVTFLAGVLAMAGPPPVPAETAVVTITRSTVSGNTAVNDGGGIFSVGGAVSLGNSTVSGNLSEFGMAGGLGAANAGIANSTVASNQPTGVEGLDLPGTISIIGSLIVRNGTDCATTAPVISAGTDSVDTDGTCGSADTVPQLKLGQLSSNGGPTPTHALFDGSAALNRVPEIDCPDIDQRGEPRKQADGFCDGGAFELTTTISCYVTVGAAGRVAVFCL